MEAIHSIDPITSQKLSEENFVTIFPANIFVTSKEIVEKSIKEIQQELQIRIQFFESNHQQTEAKRIYTRTQFDLEMLQELGYCPGIENYSRYLDRRQAGERPFCLIDYFPKNYLLVIDESHVTIPQIRAMWGGDQMRKLNLVEHAFRLPSALDNRPLNFTEFQSLINQVIYVSATPADFELMESHGCIVEQLIRPTGLLDPSIEVRPSLNQIDNVLKEIHFCISQKDKILVTTLTKRMAEELTLYMTNVGIKCEYIHSEVKTLHRQLILKNLQLGLIDVLVGVNLLREGIDLPEVSLVIILDADKEGFLRNVKSLIQTMGRAARHVNGRVILYADRITASMQEAIDETTRRRAMQMDYNLKNGITPMAVGRSVEYLQDQPKIHVDNKKTTYSQEEDILSMAADPAMLYMKKPQIKNIIKDTTKRMKEAAENLNFGEALRLKKELAAMELFLKNLEGR